MEISCKPLKEITRLGSKRKQKLNGAHKNTWRNLFFESNPLVEQQELMYCNCLVKKAYILQLFQIQPEDLCQKCNVISGILWKAMFTLLIEEGINGKKSRETWLHRVNLFGEKKYLDKIFWTCNPKYMTD